MNIGKINKIENHSGGIINLGTIYGNVSTAINQLPPSPLPNQAGIKELLSQLQEAIASEPNLVNEDKAEALTQVEALAQAGQNPNDEGMKKLAKQATTMLRVIAAGLPDAAKLADACSQLLPAIMKLFGIVL